MQRRAIREVLRGAAVVLCTNTVAGDDVLDPLPPFDLCIVDEAAQVRC